MDIWAWVRDAREELRENGHERLAEILFELPGLVGDGLHEQVEALLPEGLALARAIDHPWIEVFLRHWLAQSRIVDRCDVAQGMDEIVRLLDFAHGERTANCPQSVCVTQDFCIAHGELDGPGYAEERLAASAEALARIDASWPCFHCISAEYADALADQERYADAESFLRQQLRAGDESGSHDVVLVLKRADALSKLGRHAEAIEMLESIDTSDDQKSRRTLHAQLKTGEYARAGRLDEALAAHPRPTDVDPADFVRWMRNETLLCAALPARNDTQLGLTLREFCNTLRINGSLYHQGEVAMGAARLALERGRPRVAALHLEHVAEVLPRLRRPERLAREHAELLARLPAAPDSSLEGATDAAAVLEQLGDDAELNYEALRAALRTHPANEELTLALCRALQEMGFPDQAVRELESFAQAQLSSAAVLSELMRLLVRTGAETRLRELADSVPESLRAGAHFYLGRMLMQREDWAAAAQAFEQTRALEETPYRSTTSNLALVYRQLGRLEESLALLDELAQSEDDFSDDWDRMCVATLLGRHDKVRDSARRLGFTFEGEGPIDDPYAYCEVTLRDNVGRDVRYRAVRVNPVVARIIAMQAPDQPSRYRDEFLIDPAVLNPREAPPQKDGENQGEDDDYIPQFRGDRLLKVGGYRIYDLDGVHPGEEAVESLSQALADRGVLLSQRSGEGYQLTLREGEPTVLGIYVYIAVPQGIPAAEVYDILAPIVGAWTVPITFRGLLRELGNEKELARHEQIAQDLKL